EAIEQVCERQVHRTRDGAGRDLTRIADVDHDEVGDGLHALGQLHRGEARAAHDRVGTREEGEDRVGQVAHDPVEPDAGQPDLGLELRAGVAHQHDLVVGPQHVTRVLGEAAVEADV